MVGLFEQRCGGGRESDGECSRERVLDKGLDLLNLVARAERWTIRSMYSKCSVRPFSTGSFMASSSMDGATILATMFPESELISSCFKSSPIRLSWTRNPDA